MNQKKVNFLAVKTALFLKVVKTTDFQ